MKRILLIGIVSLAIAWIGYSIYELWLNKDNTAQPEFVFCELDEAILRINNLEETKATNYFDIIQENKLAKSLDSITNFVDEALTLYASKKRPIIIFEKETKWNQKDIHSALKFFLHKSLKHKNIGLHLMIYLETPICEDHLPKGLILEADKKASANYWQYSEDKQWERTDVYNLKKGFYEYQSSIANVKYGKAVRDIDLFSAVIPVDAAEYIFKERFYAQETDSVFKNSVMNQWVDKGFVQITYQNVPVIISDYRSQQIPSLILLENTNTEDSIFRNDDLQSFSNFQLTSDFPSKENSVFYSFNIEDKAFFVESEAIARRIQVDYQLGKTIALDNEKRSQFFGGLPSYSNMRDISSENKSSLTWKDKLLFQVSTKPPQYQLSVADRNDWSYSSPNGITRIIPIFDHLRNGPSILGFNDIGQYELIGPNGNKIWQGKINGTIEGKVEIIDLFENQKNQFLFRTRNKVYLIDLNGDYFGSFPYESEHDLTSGISLFEWNGTRRFLIGNKKGEITMLKNDGQELNIIQSGAKSIISTPYALNIKGNLRSWAQNSDNQQIIGYLETPAKASIENKLEENSISIKYQGKILTYFEKEGKIYQQVFDSKTGEGGLPKLVDNGKIHDVNSDYIIATEQNNIKIYSHELNIIYNTRTTFNEIESINYIPERDICIVLDYLQNKIHAFDNSGNELKYFPKEGRNFVVSFYDKRNKILHTYTMIEHSIICYKTSFNKDL
ncbi:MAG: hypothetical protein WC994_01870 [Brumimicrobium sp.]